MYGFVVGKKLATFSYPVRFLFPMEIYAYFLRISNWSANENKTLLLSD